MHLIEVINILSKLPDPERYGIRTSSGGFTLHVPLNGGVAPRGGIVLGLDDYARMDYEIILRDQPKVPQPPLPFCAACLQEFPLSEALCAERPETRIGQPMGMYHCPACGAMLVAGMKHPMICDNCQPKKGTKDE